MRWVWGVSGILAVGCALGCSQSPRHDASQWARLCDRMACDCSGPACPSSEADPRLSTSASQSLSAAIVHVEVIMRAQPVPRTSEAGEVQTTGACGGSGLVAHADGFILTNEHVIHGAEAIVVILADGRRLPVRDFVVHSGQDLALLQVDCDGLQTLPRPKSSAQAGTPVAAAGRRSPVDPAEIASGVVTRPSASLQQLLDPARHCDYGHLIESSAAVEPGFSGGPLVNAQGQLIGITVAMRRSEQNGTHAYAIPLDDHVWAEVDQLRATLLGHNRPHTPPMRGSGPGPACWELLIPIVF